MADAQATAYPLLTNATTTVTGETVSVGSTAKTIQVKGSTTSGTGTVQLVIETTNDITWPWLLCATINLNLSTTDATDGIVIISDWLYMRARVVSISGTGASVSVLMGV